jgi:17beta-estradiol 17-dehydrogenase / very-long-chain 3-oxoacyl-CoA reductase
MSKIRRPSMMVPSPRGYVRTVLRSLTSGTVVAYWSHSLLDYVMHLVPEFVVVKYMHIMHRDIRKRALKKKERLAKQQ